MDTITFTMNNFDVVTRKFLDLQCRFVLLAFRVLLTSPERFLDVRLRN
jgi:hypothetical protein